MSEEPQLKPERRNPAMSSPQRSELIGCETAFLGIKQKNFGVISYRIFPLRCHSWDCPDCARVKSKIYRERMAPLFDGRPLWMYTFTYYHDRPPLEVWRDYSRAWNRLRTAATKKYGGINYARILEHHHQSPYPHLHVIADVDLADTWLAGELASAGFGYQAKKKPVTSPEAVTYVTKYLNKPWTDDACKKIRRVLHLRIISFGGPDSHNKCAQSKWDIVSRDCDRGQIDCKCAIDRDWIYGRSVTLQSERVFDAFLEQIYILPDEILIAEAENGS
jgi:hypothetical protein